MNVELTFILYQKLIRMGFLDRYKAAQQVDLLPSWHVLDQSVHLEQLAELSNEKPVVIFKHSIRCGISSMVKEQLENDWNFQKDDLVFYYLDLINERPISNAIAERFNVLHQSPQIIILKNGESIYDTSHHNVSVRAIRNALSMNKKS